MHAIANFSLQTTEQKKLNGLYDLTWLCLQLQSSPVPLAPSFIMLQSHGLFCFLNTTCFPPILSLYRVLLPVLQLGSQPESWFKGQVCKGEASYDYPH